MSTIVSRTLTGKDVLDKLAIKVDSEIYNRVGSEKWGVFVLTITSYAISGTPTSTDKARVDIRPSGYNSETDNIIVDNVEYTSASGTVSDGTVYRFAVNGGIPSPAMRVNPDGSWDLVDITFEGHFGASASLALTVTYTLTFTDLTP